MRHLLWATILGLWLTVLAPQSLYAQSEPRAYTVVAGDTLFEIAERFGITLEELVAFNGITDPNLLEVGQTLLIPDPGSVTDDTVIEGTVPAEGAVETPNPVAELPVADVVVVRARPGETVGAIAARYGQSIEQFSALNAIDPAARLFPGQPLLAPRDVAGGEPLRFGAIRTVTVPAQITQGRTSSVIVQTSAPRQIEGSWNGLPITFVPLPDPPNRYFAYLPAPALIDPNSYWLTLTYTASNGTPLSQSWPIAIVEGDYELQELDLPDDRGGLLSADIVAPELEKVTAVWSQRTPTLYWTGVFSRPVSAEYPTTSPFGTRRTYYTGGPRSYHEGQDFGVPAGVPLLAPGDGVVALAEPLNVRGNAVIVDHGGGVFSGYWHLSEIKVVPGQAVSQGDLLGISGNTGLSTGAHVHWELRIYGIAVDPLQFLDVPLVAPQ